MQQFLGAWRGPDEYTSEVVYTVMNVGGNLVITAVDPSDGEVAEVAEVALSDGKLSFCAHWKSSGRVAKCLLEIVGENEAQLTFTYTDHARLVRTAV
jgi:hypothetical protein